MAQREFPRVAIGDLLSSDQLFERPGGAPNAAGVYAWFFHAIPPGIDTTGCYAIGDWTLLYVGISPKAPPLNGRAPSRSTLRQRLRTHFGGNAAGSTLRRTLGCLLADELGISLRRVGSGGRYTLTNPGEQKLDAWLIANARVAWLKSEEPWLVEQSILASGLPLPLNIRDNPFLAHTVFVQGVRERAMREADRLPIVADSGGPRRLRLPSTTAG